MISGKGIKQLRLDIANLPQRYRCIIDAEMREHCTLEIEGVKLGIWIDDVSLYPTKHVAQVFPDDDSQSKILVPALLQSMQLSGDISEMILTISSILSTSHETPDARMTK